MTAKSNGTRTVDTRNARPRICSRYSRLATSNRLRIGFASHGLNENLFERRLDQFEAVDGGYRRSLVEQLLCVAMRLKANFSVAGEVLGFSNLRTLQETRVAVEFNNHAVALIAGLDLAHL